MKEQKPFRVCSDNGVLNYYDREHEAREYWYDLAMESPKVAAECYIESLGIDNEWQKLVTTRSLKQAIKNNVAHWIL